MFIFQLYSRKLVGFLGFLCNVDRFFLKEWRQALAGILKKYIYLKKLLSFWNLNYSTDSGEKSFKSIQHETACDSYSLFSMQRL